jgi:hypothetical protein
MPDPTRQYLYIWVDDLNPQRAPAMQGAIRTHLAAHPP